MNSPHMPASTASDAARGVSKLDHPVGVASAPQLLGMDPIDEAPDQARRKHSPGFSMVSLQGLAAIIARSGIARADAPADLAGWRVSVLLGQVPRTLEDIQRPLLTPDECQVRPGTKKRANSEIEALGDTAEDINVYLSSYGKQSPYFKKPSIRARAAIDPSAGSDMQRWAVRRSDKAWIVL